MDMVLSSSPLLGIHSNTAQHRRVRLRHRNPLHNRRAL